MPEIVSPDSATIVERDKPLAPPKPLAVVWPSWLIIANAVALAIHYHGIAALDNAAPESRVINTLHNHGLLLVHLRCLLHQLNAAPLQRLDTLASVQRVKLVAVHAVNEQAVQRACARNANACGEAAKHDACHLRAGLALCHWLLPFTLDKFVYVLSICVKLVYVKGVRDDKKIALQCSQGE
jgi:hypothetical protein